MAQMALTEVNKIPMIQPYQRLFTLLYGATAQDKIQSTYGHMSKHERKLRGNLALFNQIVTIMSNPVGGATPTPVSDAVCSPYSYRAQMFQKNAADITMHVENILRFSEASTKEEH